MNGQQFSPYPSLDRRAQFFQPSFEEVVSAFDANEFFRLRESADERFKFSGGTELIARSADEKFRLDAIAEKLEIIRALFDRHSGQAKCDERADTVIGISGAHSHRGPERKTGNDDWQREFVLDPVKSSAYIPDFAFAASVLTFAQSGSAKIEAQDGESEPVQRLHGVEDNFVMQRSAIERMGVTDNRCMSRVGRTGIQQGFEAANWALEEERADSGVFGKHGLPRFYQPGN
jgi:hypothetical protein